jgi:hypothetical protein
MQGGKKPRLDSIIESDYDSNNMRDSLSIVYTKALQREILLGFCKIHIFHHDAGCL